VPDSEEPETENGTEEKGKGKKKGKGKESQSTICSQNQETINELRSQLKDTESYKQKYKILKDQVKSNMKSIKFLTDKVNTLT